MVGLGVEFTRAMSGALTLFTVCNADTYRCFAGQA